MSEFNEDVNAEVTSFHILLHWVQLAYSDIIERLGFPLSSGDGCYVCFEESFWSDLFLNDFHKECASLV